MFLSISYPLLLCLVVPIQVNALPNPNLHSLSSAQRQSQLKPIAHATGWQDISTTFSLVYSISQSTCATSMQLSLPVPDSRNVGILPLTDIVEDGNQCNGISPMSLVTEQTLRIPGLLTQVGLVGFRNSLNANANANAVANQSTDSQMLVGWHENDRICGIKTYDTNSFYFFINEDNGYVIEFLRNGQRERIQIPRLMAVLLLIPLDANRICLYSDLFTTSDSFVTLTTEDNRTIPLLPVGVQSPVPAIPSSSPSASVGAITVGGAGSGTSSVNPIQSSPTTETTDPATSVLPSYSPIPLVSGAASPSVVVPIEVDDDANSEDTETESSITPVPTTSSGRACFPSSSRIDNGRHTMSTLPVGYNTKNNGKVLLFTHRDRTLKVQSFKKLTFSDHSSINHLSHLIMSPGHYVPLIDGSLLPAEQVRPDGTHSLICSKSGFPKQIIAVEDVCAVGLINPQTESGTISVEGVVVSTYTTAINPVIAHRGIVWWKRFINRSGFSHSFGNIVSWLFQYGAPSIIDSFL